MCHRALCKCLPPLVVFSRGSPGPTAWPSPATRRHDQEIASAAVMVRSTPFGYCFLEEWIKLGTGALRVQ